MYQFKRIICVQFWAAICLYKVACCVTFDQNKTQTRRPTAICQTSDVKVIRLTRSSYTSAPVISSWHLKGLSLTLDYTISLLVLTHEACEIIKLVLALGGIVLYSRSLNTISLSCVFQSLLVHDSNYKRVTGFFLLK